MRRGASIAVVLAFVCALLAPMAQTAVSSAPACCLADGKHHCMGLAGMDGFHAQASSCPYRTCPAVAGGKAAFVAAAITVSRPQAVASRLMAGQAAVSSLTISDPRKRGPPSA